MRGHVHAALWAPFASWRYTLLPFRPSHTPGLVESSCALADKRSETKLRAPRPVGSGSKCVRGCNASVSLWAQAAGIGCNNLTKALAAQLPQQVTLGQCCSFSHCCAFRLVPCITHVRAVPATSAGSVRFDPKYIEQPVCGVWNHNSHLLLSMPM